MGTMGEQAYLSEGSWDENQQTPKELSLLEGGDSIPTSSFCDRVKKRKADLIIKNINT